MHLRSGVRDRRGHGQRGPGVGPGSPALAKRRSRAERFDDLVLSVVTELDGRWQHDLGLVEFAVEDAPMVPDDWGSEQVPLSSLIRGSSTAPTKLVVFRRPIERRAHTRADMEALVFTVVVEQIAELLDIAPEDVDPRYGP